MENYENFNPDIHEYVDVNDETKGFVFKKSLSPVTDSVRIITTGSMQRRFTVEEEVAMLQDDAAKVIRDRLFTVSYCDLDFKDTVDGVTYIIEVLATKLSWTPDFKEARLEYLLSDGLPNEVYKGVL